ncbi:hypothetical protein [Streptomyces sp. NTK 937]|uniref:hypothetical protein n=1 Tax=Streptomyces sp. NTK 937 TaxID=1487711 RepID=UPI0004A94154|nr:hypothetical protein [Streptomyces sp. NTK 937]KDQ65725.1 hypothetical protein DT87_00265 [Streptomyces sp. NTK 937]
MSEYKVGDRALLRGDEVEVTYGPFTSPSGFLWVVVRREDGREDTARRTDLEALPRFAVGDRVTMGFDDEYTASAGPFNGISAEFWVLKRADGTHLWSRADALTKVEPTALVPVGTRVRVDRATYAGYTHGQVGTVTSNTGDFRAVEGDRHLYRIDLGFDNGDVYAAEVTPVDETTDDAWTYEGVTYAPFTKQ